MKEEEFFNWGRIYSLPFEMVPWSFSSFFKSSWGLSIICSSIIKSFSEFASDEQSESFRFRSVTGASELVAHVEDENDMVDATTDVGASSILFDEFVDLSSLTWTHFRLLVDKVEVSSVTGRFVAAFRTIVDDDEGNDVDDDDDDDEDEDNDDASSMTFFVASHCCFVPISWS